MVPRTVIFAGKAAPSYFMAKRIIKLINSVACVIDADPVAGRLLKVLFIPNYDVSTAEDVIPAAELSQQISTAGTEASGTGNMKLALNGALTRSARATGRTSRSARRSARRTSSSSVSRATKWHACARKAATRRGPTTRNSPSFANALDMLRDGYFSPDEPDLFRCLFDSLTDGGDPFMVLADFASYMECQARVDAVYRDPRRLDPQVHRQRREDGPLLLRPHGPRIRGGHLGDETPGERKPQLLITKFKAPSPGSRPLRSRRIPAPPGVRRLRGRAGPAAPPSAGLATARR